MSVSTVVEGARTVGAANRTNFDSSDFTADRSASGPSGSRLSGSGIRGKRTELEQARTVSWNSTVATCLHPHLNTKRPSVADEDKRGELDS